MSHHHSPKNGHVFYVMVCVHSRHDSWSGLVNIHVLPFQTDCCSLSPLQSMHNNLRMSGSFLLNVRFPKKHNPEVIYFHIIFYLDACMYLGVFSYGCIHTGNKCCIYGNLELWRYSTTHGIEHCAAKTAENCGVCCFLNRRGFKAHKKLVTESQASVFVVLFYLGSKHCKCSFPDLNAVNKELSCKAFKRGEKNWFSCE